MILFATDKALEYFFGKDFQPKLLEFDFNKSKKYYSKLNLKTSEYKFPEIIEESLLSQYQLLDLFD